MGRRTWTFGIRFGDAELRLRSEPEASLLPISPWLIERLGWLAVGLAVGDLVHRYLS